MPVADGAGLLAAKLSVPQAPPGLVQRPRLLDRLNHGTQGPVTLLSAGPGWGKTMLAAAWANTEGATRPVSWLSLDADDNDPMLFWSYVVAALRLGGAVPARHQLTEPAVAGPRHESERLRRIARSVAALPEPVVLVLDDLQEIQNTEVLEDLATLLRHPSALRLVLVTRTDPRLPLHRLRVRGELTELRSVDLAFTEAEADALFRGADLDLGPESRRLVLDRCEGWATGLRLAALLAAGPGKEQRIEAFAGDVGSVAEYLGEEVLAAQPAPLRRFLLRTSIAERLCGDLADTLTDTPGGQRALEELERANAFVIAMGPRPRWFRYHPLLADLLRHELELEDPELVPRLHRRAALWFAAQGSVVEAVRHAARSRDWPLMGRLVVTHAAIRVLSAERQAMAELLAKIPADELSATAELETCAALRQFIARDYAAIPAHLARARALLDERDAVSRRPTELVLRMLDMVTARIDGDMPGLIAAASDVLAWLPEITPDMMPAAPYCRPPAQSNLGVGLLWTGQTELADASLQSALAASEEAGLELAELNTLGHLALLESIRGRLGDANAHASAALTLAERRGWTGLAQNIATYLTLALTHLHQNNLPEAERMLASGIAAQRREGERVPLVALNAVLARVLLAGGGLERARQAVARGREAATGWALPRLLTRWLTIAEAEVDLTAGDPAAVVKRLHSAGADDPADELAVLAARAHLALGELRQADRLLTPLRDGKPAEAGPVDTTAAWVVTALIADRNRADHRATDALTRALSQASADGIRRPFLVLDRLRLPVLLRRQRRVRPQTAAFADELLESLGEAGEATRAVTPLTAPLTDRELTVLELLATMETNEEIAADLYVSVNTVKAHARALYRKLDVANRRQAVARARELGLF